MTHIFADRKHNRARRRRALFFYLRGFRLIRGCILGLRDFRVFGVVRGSPEDKPRKKRGREKRTRNDWQVGKPAPRRGVIRHSFTGLLKSTRAGGPFLPCSAATLCASGGSGAW